MAQKRPEGRRRKAPPRKEAREETAKVVLVGTYKGDQLTRWRGWYNYPISEGDFNVGTPKGGENKQTDLLTPNGVRGAGGSQLVATGKTDAMNCVPPDFSRINELWLFNGTKGRKTFKAEFVGVKTREELIRDYGYPAKGKAHGERYLLFKTEFMYQHKLTPPEEAERVVVRTADFARSPKIRSQLKAYLESPDRNDPDLAKRLPEIITKLRPDQLRVCEAAVQLEFDLLTPKITSTKTSLGMVPREQFNLYESDFVAVRQSPLSMMSVEEVKDKIFQGDCLSILPKFPAASVDMILCDLPYGTTQNKWDSVIPLDLLWAEYKRILKPNGSVVLTSQGMFTAKLVLSNPSWFKYKIVWVKSKPTNFLNAKVQPLRKHEDVCVFYGHHCTYNPVMGEGVPYDKGVRKNQLSGSYGDFRPVHVQSSGKRYPTDVVYFKTAESEGEVWHPTQKPVELGRYLVKTFSNPGDLVLDNAFGSGSFLLAAALENRHFVGIEKNESVALFKEKSIDYLDIAMSRLNGILKRREVS